MGGFWGLALPGRGTGYLGFLVIFLAMGIGYADRRVGGRRDEPQAVDVALQACAIFGVIVAYFVRNAVAGVPLLPAGDIWGYLATFLAAFLAAQRLQR